LAIEHYYLNNCRNEENFYGNYAAPKTTITVPSCTEMQGTANSHHLSQCVGPPQMNTCT